MRKLNQSGFTMTEILIAAGLGTIVMSAISYVVMNASKQTNMARQGLEQLSDDMLIERVLVKDLAKVGPSFNVLSQPFFDYLPDGSCTASTCKRSVELVGGGEMWMLIADSLDVGAPTPFDPKEAYQIAGNSLSFDPVKLKTFMTSYKLDINKQIVKDSQGKPVPLFGKMWQKDQLLLFYCPVPLRATSTDLVPRLYGFVGQVGKDANSFQLINPVVPDAAGFPRALFTMTHPLTGNSIPDLDTMLRQLPAVGGTGTFVLVRPVKLIRYQLEKTKGVLSRAEIKDFLQIKNNGEFLIAKGVKKMNLRRETIASPVMHYSYDWDSPSSSSSPSPTPSASSTP